MWDEYETDSDACLRRGVAGIEHPALAVTGHYATEANMNQDVEIVHAVTEPMRYAILCLLMEHDYCVRALARKLGISEPAVSQHMNVLKRYALVEGRKLGYQVHYKVDRQRLGEALAAVARELTSEGEERELKRKCTCEFADECIRGGRQGARPGE